MLLYDTQTHGAARPQPYCSRRWSRVIRSSSRCAVSFGRMVARPRRFLRGRHAIRGDCPARVLAAALHSSCARACSRSAMMSALSSMPIDRRTTSGPAPAAVRCSSVSWRCVVDAG